MKYIEALKKYNEGKDKWCMPRKGSEDYLNIIKMVKNVLKNKKDKLDTSNIILFKKPSSKSLLFKNANIIQRFLKNKLIIKKNNLILSCPPFR